MQVYRLGAVDPEPLIETLNDLGVLDPTTRLQVDKRNKSIIAYAPMADHLTIRALVNKLDGSGRKFEVIQLRRLEADYVAGTDRVHDRRRRQGETAAAAAVLLRLRVLRGGHQQEEKSNDKFRVDADVENNRLLLWANPIEMEEVMNLLAKLGESPPAAATPTRCACCNSSLARTATTRWNASAAPGLRCRPTRWSSRPAMQSSEARAPPRSQRSDAEEARSPPVDQINRCAQPRDTHRAQGTVAGHAEPGETVAVVAAPAVLRAHEGRPTSPSHSRRTKEAQARLASASRPKNRKCLSKSLRVTASGETVNGCPTADGEICRTGQPPTESRSMRAAQPTPTGNGSGGRSRTP